MSFSRRGFLHALLGGGILGWLGSAIYPIISYLKPPKVPEANVHTVEAGAADAFPVNSGQIIRFGRLPVILIRTDTGEFRAFSATCTHLDCIVQYRPDLKEIHCACHNGLYDLTGRNVSGPPPRPLDEFAVNVVDNDILVSRPRAT